MTFIGTINSVTVIPYFREQPNCGSELQIPTNQKVGKVGKPFPIFI